VDHRLALLFVQIIEKGTHASHTSRGGKKVAARRRRNN